jgi:hypothetical protein
MVNALMVGELARTALQSLGSSVNPGSLGRLLAVIRPAPGLGLGGSLALLGTGIAIGTGIGMFMAPRSGRELRESCWKAIQSGMKKAPKSSEADAPYDPHSTRNNGGSRAQA